MPTYDPAAVLTRLVSAIGRRDFLRAVAAVTAVSAGTGLITGCGSSAAAPAGAVAPLPDAPLQPGAGPIDGDHYLPSTAESVRWGYVPAIGAAPVLRVGSGQTVTIDAVSHEGILEDQGRDPVAYFSRYGVREAVCSPTPSRSPATIGEPRATSIPTART